MSPPAAANPLRAVAPLLAVALAACGQAPEQAQPPREVGAAAAEAGYAVPPQLTGATRRGDRLLLTGRAPAGAEVRLAAPDGRLLRAVAAGDGGWGLELPAPDAPAMFAFSAAESGRMVRGEGAVILLPPPAPPALLARAGFGVLGLGQGGPTPTILALDYDQSGGAAVSGLAAPNARVRLSLDGSPAGLGQADARGRFAVIAANRTLAPGPRRLEIETDQGRAQVAVVASPAAPLDGQPFRAARVEGGWRIDWAPPGGGVQSTLVFEQREPAV